MRISKWIAAVAGLLAFSASVSFAQDARIGALGSIGASYLTIDEPYGRKMGSAGSVGVYSTLPLAGSFRLQPELHWSFKNADLTLTDSRGTSASLPFAFQYLSIPVLVRMPLFWGLHMVEGPVFHLPMKGTLNGDDIKASMNKDIGIVIGVGVQKGRLDIEGRWDSGFKTATTIDLFPNRNRTFTALVGIRLK